MVIWNTAEVQLAHALYVQSPGYNPCYNMTP